jgi:hypothetical protein
MRTTLITVPAEMVEDLRDGVYAELRNVAEVVIQATQTAGHLDHPERYHQQRLRACAACALLDLIGWTGGDPPVELQVDLAQHRVVLLAALCGARDDAGGALEDAATGRQTDPSKREASTQRAHKLQQLVSAVEAQASDAATPAFQ